MFGTGLGRKQFKQEENYFGKIWNQVREHLVQYQNSLYFLIWPMLPVCVSQCNCHLKPRKKPLLYGWNIYIYRAICIHVQNKTFVQYTSGDLFKVELICYLNIGM